MRGRILRLPLTLTLSMPVMTEIEPHSLMASETAPDGLYPIREVCRLTGINPVTLRAWERRYGLIAPKRTESGHRLYCAGDIETVRQVQRWIERGVAVSKVGELLARADFGNSPQVPTESGECTQWQLRIGAALSAFNEPELDRLYGQIFSSYPLETVFQGIFLPLWQRLLRAQDEFGRTSEWLMLDSFLRGRVQHRLQLQPATSEPCVLLLGLPEQCRELEVWVLGVLLARNDRVVRVLAMGQPLEELSLVCEKVQPQAVVLFSSRALSAAHIQRVLKLSHTLNCSTYLAGEASDLAQEALAGSVIGCLGTQAQRMSQRLDAFLKGTLDT